MTYRNLIILVLISGFTSTAYSSDSIQVLKEKCEAAREAKLAPERQALIKSCIAEKEKPADECERYYADYGAGGRTAAGAGKVRKYNNLPECEALYKAEREEK